VQVIDNPRLSLATGFVLAGLLLAGALTGAGGDPWSVTSLVLRFLHVLAAMVWIGLGFFVNFVQLAVLRAADDQGRAFLGKHVIPAVAWWFRYASTATVITGALLLVAAGYVWPSLVYGSDVYVMPARAWLLWSGVIGGLVMLMFVHMYIWPAMQVVLGLRPADPGTTGRARDRVVLFARLNLIIALPVTLAMLAAAHLY
jgi:uncharacterized membrane protein